MTATASTTSSVEPAALYASPHALAADGDLTLSERIGLLRRWAFEERCELAQGDAVEPGDVRRLRDIARLLARLESRELEPARRSDPRPAAGDQPRPRLAILLGIVAAYGALAGLVVAFGDTPGLLVAATAVLSLFALLILGRTRS